MSNNEQNKGNHPAYQEILDALPDSLHAAIIPTLKKWDAGVTQKMQEIHQSYESLKQFQPFIDNKVDFDYVAQAVTLADELQRDPNNVVKRINESWDLGYVDPEQAKALQSQQPSSSGESEDDDDFFGDDDLMNNPKVKAMYQSLQEIQNSLKSEREKEQQEQEIAEFEEYLDELEKQTTDQNLPFNRLFVTALMDQGVDGEEAVKQYHQVLAQATSTQDTEQATDTTQSSTDAPVVMGGHGQVGSGTPDGTIDFAALSKNDTAEIVAQMLAQAQESGQG